MAFSTVLVSVTVSDARYAPASGPHIPHVAIQSAPVSRRGCTDPHTLLIVGKRQPCSDEVPKKPRLLTEGLEADWSQTLRAIRGALTRNLETCRPSKVCGPLAHIEQSADRGAYRRFLRGSRTALSC